MAGEQPREEREGGGGRGEGGWEGGMEGAGVQQTDSLLYQILEPSAVP